MSAVPNNRPSYLTFGLAWLLGYAAFALTYGDDPNLPIPSAVAPVLLLGGLLAGLIVTGVFAVRAQRGTHGREAVVGILLAASWLIGFSALYLIITALETALHDVQVQTLLWPTGSGLVVGMIYLAGGAAYRDLVQYTLGAWLAVTSSAALLLDGASLYWVLAIAGGGGYLVAALCQIREPDPDLPGRS
ncbi:ABC transporter permease [Nocardia suismassiliense]|uniref:ABC transporter permease n=1 Tax=Nocardia suismassiliense TaxID=2077092 RepID=UPI001F25DD35|nr:ABC transporter permease [Nocardia suismassiliense]